MGGHGFGSSLPVGIAAFLLFFVSACFVEAAPRQLPAPLKPPSHEDKSSEEAVDLLEEGVEEDEEDASFHLPKAAPPHKSAAWVLEQMSQTDNPAIRRRAWEAWPLEESDSETLEPLIQQFSDPSPAVRASAEQRLATQSPSTIFAYVMRSFSSGDTTKVHYLERALPSLPSEVGGYLLETLDTELELPLHRHIAAYALGRMGHRTGIEGLTRHVWSSDGDLAYRCVEALHAINDPKSLSLWMQLLGHDNPHIRSLATRALSVLQSPAALEQIRGLVLQVGNETAQVNALSATEFYPAEWQFPLLVEVLEKNPTLAGHALRMLRQRTGMRFGTNPAQWKNWVDSLFTPQVPPLVPSE